jgi:hypothetical protein
MLKLTPEFTRGIYILLKYGPVFSKFNLPAAAAVKFRVTRAKDRCGYYQYLPATGRHEIGLDQPYCASLEHATETMAHEMIHLYQAVNKSESRKADHNVEFHRIAKRVCAAYGFPLSRFV